MIFFFSIMYVREIKSYLILKDALCHRSSWKVMKWNCGTILSLNHIIIAKNILPSLQMLLWIQLCAIVTGKNEPFDKRERTIIRSTCFSNKKV